MGCIITPEHSIHCLIPSDTRKQHREGRRPSREPWPRPDPSVTYLHTTALGSCLQAPDPPIPPHSIRSEWSKTSSGSTAANTAAGRSGNACRGRSCTRRSRQSSNTSRNQIRSLSLRRGRYAGSMIPTLSGGTAGPRGSADQMMAASVHHRMARPYQL